MTPPQTDLPARLRALLWEWRTRADAERIAAEGQPQRERELLEHSADGYYACAAELEAELDDLAAALQGPETAPPGTVTQDLRDWLRESLRTRLLFGCSDEPLNDAGCRVVRAIIDRLDRAADAPSPAPHGWQPIETAPRDTRVLASFPRYGVLCAVLISGTNTWVGQALERVGDPTHWQPLSPPPPAPDRPEER